MNSRDFDLPKSVSQAFARLERGAPEFEHRPSQGEMARRWSETLVRGGALVIEAPTGVGKSLAYLLPALVLRAGGSGPIVVSTHTKALQAQLIDRDVPIAARALGRAVRAATLKGRASYLCRRRAQGRLRQRRLFAGGAGAALDAETLERLETWIERTTSGNLEELASLGISSGSFGGLAAEIASDPIFCSGPDMRPLRPSERNGSGGRPRSVSCTQAARPDLPPQYGQLFDHGGRTSGIRLVLDRHRGTSDAP
jgi:hypothetical protein